jgi:hypothetical protein
MAGVIELRQLLREKFPGLATRADELAVPRRNGWASGLTKLDEQLGGGFPRSAITEVIAPRLGVGSALLLRQLLRRAASTAQFLGFIDGRDSFDAASVDQSALSRLLWMRCHTAEEAVKAADLVLRDGNLQVVLLDLALNPALELRRIPAPAWYRFQRLVEESQVVFIAVTPHAMISPAEVRVTLRSRLGLKAMEENQVKLTLELDFEVAELRHAAIEPLRKSA